MTPPCIFRNSFVARVLLIFLFLCLIRWVWLSRLIADLSVSSFKDVLIGVVKSNSLKRKYWVFKSKNRFFEINIRTKKILEMINSLMCFVINHWRCLIWKCFSHCVTLLWKNSENRLNELTLQRVDIDNLVKWYRKYWFLWYFQ
jgi:hypothetical protein